MEKLSNSSMDSFRDSDYESEDELRRWKRKRISHAGFTAYDKNVERVEAYYKIYERKIETPKEAKLQIFEYRYWKFDRIIF